eukprot:974091-Prymnesium_polylepis.1
MLSAQVTPQYALQAPVPCGGCKLFELRYAVPVIIEVSGSGRIGNFVVHHPACARSVECRSFTMV